MSTTTLHRFLVVGPERTWVDVCLDDGTGPSFPEHDVYLVDAPTRHAAKWAAWRRAKENKDAWYRDLDFGHEHPLRGVKVEPVEGESENGWPPELVVKVEVAA